MPKTRIMMPSVDAIAIIMQRKKVPSMVAYDTVKSTPSIMDDPCEIFFSIDNIGCQCQLFLL